MVPMLRSDASDVARLSAVDLASQLVKQLAGEPQYAGWLRTRSRRY